MNSLSPREQRLIAILILLAIIATVWFALISPILAGFANRAEQRTALSQQFVSNDRLISGIARLRRQGEAQRIDYARFHTGGTTLAESSDLLSERLGNAVSAAGGDVRSVQDVSDRPGWARASIEARMTLAQSIALLDSLQNVPPLLVINALILSADRSLVSGKLDLMDIRIEVSSPIAPTKQH